MNSGSVMKADIKQLADVEQAVLEHSLVFGITTSDIWGCVPTLQSFGRVAVGGVVRKLTRSGLLLRGTLHFSRYCFVFNPAANTQVRMNRKSYLAIRNCSCTIVRDQSSSRLIQSNS
jgi:hypothetical protein